MFLTRRFCWGPLRILRNVVDSSSDNIPTRARPRSCARSRSPPGTGTGCTARRPWTRTWMGVDSKYFSSAADIFWPVCDLSRSCSQSLIWSVMVGGMVALTLELLSTCIWRNLASILVNQGCIFSLCWRRKFWLFWGKSPIFEFWAGFLDKLSYFVTKMF